MTCHGREVPIDDVRVDLLGANEELSNRGLRVLAFAARNIDEATMAHAAGDPMAVVADLALVRVGPASSTPCGPRRETPYTAPSAPVLT